MKKKGFTLIELLAVIVILAVIALIATPLILNVIDKAKKNAFLDAGYGITASAEYYYAEYLLNQDRPFSDAKFLYKNGQAVAGQGGMLSYKGQAPQSGMVAINKRGQIAMSIWNGNYCVTKDYSNDHLAIKKSKEEDCTFAMTEVVDRILMLQKNSVFDSKKMVRVFDRKGIDVTSQTEITYQSQPSLDLSKIGQYKITYQIKMPDGETIEYDHILSVVDKAIWDYDLTRAEQVYSVPNDGSYFIEAWGASGGDMGSYTGGNGGYSAGDIGLIKGQSLYVYVGQQGSCTEGYNGGPGPNNCSFGSGGGGGTDVRLKGGLWNNPIGLGSRIIVAGGGGASSLRGQGYGEGNGGFGGGLIAGTGTSVNHGSGEWYTGSGGTQIKGGDTLYTGTTPTGTQGYFGSGCPMNSSGGGGYYGGGGSSHGAAGGGSSYISGHPGCIATKSETDNGPKTNVYQVLDDAKHYSGYIFDYRIMIPGNKPMPNYKDQTQITGNDGNGHVRITQIR